MVDNHPSLNDHRAVELTQPSLALDVSTNAHSVRALLDNGRMKREAICLASLADQRSGCEPVVRR